MSTRPNLSQKSHRSRWFYPAASLVLLAVTLIGFRYFYLHLQAYPGRPLPPSARPIFLIHGALMTGWILLAAVQPFLIALKRKRIHMTLGKFATGLAVGVVVTGYLIAIGATKGTPPEVVRFGLAPVPFLAVPLSGITTFAVFVGIGIVYRRRAEIHRPAMFLASLAVVAAALGRITVLNHWYAGTFLERWLSAFVSMLILGALLLALKCAIERRFDRWFAGGLAVLLLICVFTSLIATTSNWERFAMFLLH